MDYKIAAADKAAVPLYAKIGWVVAWIVMLGLAMMILRNCATSVIYGVKTDQQTINNYYQAGIRDGSSGQEQNLQGQAEKNSVLRKAYTTGYREGIDRGRQQVK